MFSMVYQRLVNNNNFKAFNILAKNAPTFNCFDTECTSLQMGNTHLHHLKWVCSTHQFPAKSQRALCPRWFGWDMHSKFRSIFGSIQREHKCGPFCIRY